MFINFVQRLQAEVVAWHKLCHRNVSQLIGVVQFDDSIGMVSPWCDNGTISHYLKNHSQANRMSLVSLDIFLTLNSILIGQQIIQIASGIVYLHAFEPVIIHGDLKGVRHSLPALRCSALMYPLIHPGQHSHRRTWAPYHH